MKGQQRKNSIQELKTKTHSPCQRQRWNQKWYWGTILLKFALLHFHNQNHNLNVEMRLILLDSNGWLSHYNVQLLQIELQCGPLDSKSQRCLTHSYALFEDCFQCPSHILHWIFTEHDVACKWSEQRIDSGICQISSFKLRGWGRLWHQRGFKWEGKGHVSLDQQIQLTQAPWKERNLLSEAAGLSIHVHHHLENYQFRADVDITLNSELWGIQPIHVNMWHDAKVN